MKRIKVGIYGIDHNHCAAKVAEMLNLPDLFEIVGVYVENDEVKNRRGHDKCYEGLKFMSEEELFAIKDVDLMLVEPAVENLVPFAQVCIDKGYHIHLDKPAGINLNEFKHLLMSAKKKDLIIQMGYMYRYNHAIQYAISQVKEGFVGKPFSIDASMSTGLNVDFKKRLISYNVKSPSMYIYGCHMIDLIVSVLGEPLRVVPFNKCTKADGLDFEDSGFAILEYEFGVATVRINSSEINGWERREFTICGDEGTVSVRPIENPTHITVCHKDYAKSWSSCSKVVELEPQVGRYTDQFKHLYKMIQKEELNPYTYDHEYIVHKLTLQACGYDIKE